METLVRLLTVAAVVYSLVVALAYFFQRNLLYFPDKTAIPPALTAAPDMQVVALRAADGVTLQAWYKAARIGGPTPRPTIVLFHGNAGNLAYRADKARVFLDRGYGVLLAAYRGYGGSDGSPSEAGLLADGRAAMDFLRASGVAAETIVLYGESLGSGIAVAMAGEYEVAAMLLEAPYSSIADVAAAHYGYLPVRWLIKDKFESMARIGAVSVPLLAVHGERDEVIPNVFGRRLFEAANEPKTLRIIPGAQHNNLFTAGGRDAALEFLGGLFPEGP